MGDDAPPPGIGDRIASRYRIRPMGAAYQGATEAVLAIVLATAGGYWADSSFGTSPLWLLVGATIGFAAFVLRLYRLGSLLNQAPEDELASGERAADASTQVSHAAPEVETAAETRQNEQPGSGPRRT